jgi:23S rRNA (uracil1939-C5)-methyltransferase
MSKKRTIHLKIESMTPKGTGKSHYTDASIQVHNRPVEVWGAFTGEIIEADIYKKRGGTWIGVPSCIIETPLTRTAPRDEVYLSSSPWQCISLTDELGYKLEIARNVFAHIPAVHEILIKKSPRDIVHTEHIWNYRNKMEYHIYENQGEYPDAGPYIVSIFGRREQRRIPIRTNALAVAGLHEYAEELIRQLSLLVPVGRSLKTLIVRAHRGGVAGALFIKDIDIARRIREICINPQTDVERIYATAYASTLTLYVSDPESPASVPTELVYAPSIPEISFSLLGTELKCGMLSFFQVHIELAELLLTDLVSAVRKMIESEYTDKTNIHIVDLYAGVGTIGLVLMHQLRGVFSPDLYDRLYLTSVEEHPEAGQYAQRNIQHLGLQDVAISYVGDSATYVDLIATADMLIVDPPRGGLHPRCVSSIVHTRPTYVIYQSCNIESQARDMEALQQVYDVIDMRLYNFFPRTPHVESLIMLKRKDGTVHTPSVPFNGILEA